MFLRLTPIVAAGRALAALAITTASMSGHASVGHMHMDFARAALGFLLLLAFAWGCQRRSTLLAGALLAQSVVHGSLRFPELRMLVIHIGAAFLAGALTWHFEGLWGACVSALQPLFRLPLNRACAPPTPRGAIRCTVWRSPFHSTLLVSTLPRRGPPVLA